MKVDLGSKVFPLVRVSIEVRTWQRLVVKKRITDLPRPLQGPSSNLTNSHQNLNLVSTDVAIFYRYVYMINILVHFKGPCFNIWIRFLMKTGDISGKLLCLFHYLNLYIKELQIYSTFNLKRLVAALKKKKVSCKESLLHKSRTLKFRHLYSSVLNKKEGLCYFETAAIPQP